MTEEPKKKKNDEQAEGVEWSFDFANFGESVKGFFSNLAGDVEIETSEFNIARAGVESATVRVDYSVGRGTLSAISDADTLFKAQVGHVGELEFSAEGDSHKEIILKQAQKLTNRVVQQGFRALANSKDLVWNVSLAAGLPLRLDLDGGVGETDINLTGLTVLSVDLDAGVGAVKMTLPQQDEHIDVEIDSGVGQTKIYIPDGASAFLDIDAGVGAVEITVPPNSAVQLRGESGLGAINVPPTMTRISGSDEIFDRGGVWQSAGFDLADRKITIEYDGGVGQLTIREAELV